MDRGAWWAIVHGVTKSRTWLTTNTHTHTHTHTHTQHVYNRKKLYMHNANVIIDTVFVNFMCHTEWTTKCPDISSNIFLGVFVRVFWIQLSFKLGEWNRSFL